MSVAGLVKVGDSQAAARAVNAYELMPWDVAQVVGAVTPMLAVAVGIRLLAGLARRLAAAVTPIMIVVVVAGISSAWARIVHRLRLLQQRRCAADRAESSGRIASHSSRARRSRQPGLQVDGSTSGGTRGSSRPPAQLPSMSRVGSADDGARPSAARSSSTSAASAMPSRR
ncbi:MauE/DoxX family redox-associated membrane protein [Catellatospora methionotrophica]|uniref:MauE/DoxX family redox-associated membrane protein n=1 Tax=Catellatospora methionotrophica TaxID=121620 RepID=UPI0030B803AE